eukprot:scaffold24740_cov66-Attheya_sp.AAC.2
MTQKVSLASCYPITPLSGRKQGLPLLITSRQCQRESWQIKTDTLRLMGVGCWLLGGDDDDQYWWGVCVEANNPLVHSLSMERLL